MMHNGNRPHGLDSVVRVCMKKKLSTAIRPVTIILTKTYQKHSAFNLVPTNHPSQLDLKPHTLFFNQHT